MAAPEKTISKTATQQPITLRRKPHVSATLAAIIKAMDRIFIGEILLGVVDCLSTAKRINSIKTLLIGQLTRSIFFNSGDVIYIVVTNERF